MQAPALQRVNALQRFFDAPPGSRRWDVALLLVVLTVAAFVPVMWCGFISLDDGHYVLQNPIVQQPLSFAALQAAFHTEVLGLWHPLGLVSLMIDHALYGNQPLGYHVTNLLLHVGSVLVLFMLLRQMTGCLWRSALVAALFAVHPLRVESVAWISERKDVLSVLLGLLALWAYVRFVRQSARPWYSAALWYLVMAALLALSLMAKPMLLAFPGLLLLLDFWPLQRWRRLGAAPGANFRRHAWPILVLEKLPLVLLVAGMLYWIVGGEVHVIVNTALAPASAVTTPTPIPTLPGFHERLANTPISYARYLGKMIWFGNLAVNYPFPAQLPGWQVASATLLLAGITLLVFWRWRKNPWLVVGWCWFIGTLFPAIGLVQVGGFAMADRYTYFPCIGLMMALVWSLPARVLGTRRNQQRLAVASGLVLATLVVFTWVQLGYWKDSIALYRHAIAVCEPNYRLYACLGQAQIQAGDDLAAVASLERAAELKPESPTVRVCLMAALDHLGLDDEADRQLAAAVGMFPESQRAGVLQATNAQRAQEQFMHAAALEGRADATQSSHRAAIAAYRRVVQLAPGNASAYYNMANCLYGDQDLDGAIAAYRQTIALNPAKAEAHFNLAVTLAARHQRPEALREAERVRQLDAARYRQLQQILGSDAPAQ